MPSEDAPHRAGQPTRIPNPDQLQQARRPDAARTGRNAAVRDDRRPADPPASGVLGQLATERAHD